MLNAGSGDEVNASTTGTSLTLVVVLSLLGGCATRNGERLLVVGGIHELDAAVPCHLRQIEPPSALKNLGWQNTLAVRARSEGGAELACGADHARLRIVTPDRLEIRLVDEHVVVGQRFSVVAKPFDRAGRELEIGHWTELVWRHDSVIAPVYDRPSSELFSCDSCFGMQGFLASAAGTVTIEARLGEATGTLRVTVQPR